MEPLHLLQVLRGVEDAVVLDLCRDQMVSLALQTLQGPLQGPVVRLGAAAREKDLVRLGVQSLGHLDACRLDRLTALGRKGVDGRRVAEKLRKIRRHRCQNIRVRRRRRRVVEIHALHRYPPIEK